MKLAQAATKTRSNPFNGALNTRGRDGEAWRRAASRLVARSVHHLVGKAKGPKLADSSCRIRVAA